MQYKALIFISLFCIISCKKSFSFKEENASTLLAEVGSNKLYISDLNEMINTSDKEDSLRVLKGLINNWVGDQLMILEAEKNLDKDINLEKMIQDYRASLLLYNYETKLAGELLDTLISPQQREAYYNSHSEEYNLVEPILKYKIAKIAKKVEGLDKFYKNWKDNNDSEVKEFCKQYAEFYDLDDIKYRPVSSLEAMLPKDLISKSLLSDENSIRKSKDDFEYFIDVTEYIKEDEKPPFDYIQSMIEKVLLNERKRDLIKNKKAQLMAQEKQSNNVKIYVKD
jgi:hypothetical protein